MTRLLSAFFATLLLTATAATIVKADPGDAEEWCWRKPWGCPR